MAASNTPPRLKARGFFRLSSVPRRLNKAGYAKFRNFLLYGERGLAGEEAVVNIFQDLLTLEYQQEKCPEYPKISELAVSEMRQDGQDMR